MELAKKAAAEKAAEHIRDGMLVGLGTGSTAFWAIKACAEKVRLGMQIRAVATSVQTENLAKSLGINMVSFANVDHLDICIDGADEVDVNMNLLKGGGGALLREKIVATASKLYIIIVDESKKVEKLGRFKLPVELVPFGYELNLGRLQQMGALTSMRKRENDLFVTDNGNYIVDCDFGLIDNPSSLHNAINAITGVVDNGLFVGMADKLIVGRSDGSVTVATRN